MSLAAAAPPVNAEIVVAAFGRCRGGGGTLTQGQRAFQRNGSPLARDVVGPWRTTRPVHHRSPLGSFKLGATMPTTTWIRNIAIAVAISCAAGVGGSWFALILGGDVKQDMPFSAQAFLDDFDEQPDLARLSAGVFARNLAVYVLLLGGIISGGLTTVFTLAFNGFILGQMFGLASAAGVPVSAALWLIAPHGVLELSLLLLAAAIGLQGPAAALLWARGAQLPWASGRVWRTALIGVPLLGVAAAIEGYLTIPIARAALLP